MNGKKRDCETLEKIAKDPFPGTNLSPNNFTIPIQD
jgi:hypothetical protein